MMLLFISCKKLFKLKIKRLVLNELMNEVKDLFEKFRFMFFLLRDDNLTVAMSLKSNREILRIGSIKRRSWIGIDIGKSFHNIWNKIYLIEENLIMEI